MKLIYSLSKEELEEGFRCAAWRMDRWMYCVHVWILAALGVGILAAYAADPDKFYLFVMLVLDVFLLFSVVYLMPFLRKRRVREMMKRKGNYQIDILPRAVIRGNDKSRVPLEKGKVQVVYTKKVCVLWVYREWYIIPRRVMDHCMENKLRQMLEEKNCRFIHLAVD